MSQAHYLRCGGAHVPGVSPAAIVTEVLADGREVPLCRRCLNWSLDRRDDLGLNDPVRLEWIFGPDTRWCIVHHWPAELCEGWDHRALIEQLRATYADERPSARSDDPT